MIILTNRINFVNTIREIEEIAGNGKGFNLVTAEKPTFSPVVILRKPPRAADEESPLEILQPFGLQDEPSEDKKLPEGSIYIIY